MNTPIGRSALISDCGRYRWWLSRIGLLTDCSKGLYPGGKGVCCFVMLNPSTADGLQDDPTIRRCIGFARRWGYGGLTVRNLFPWRATNPKALLRVGDLSVVTGGNRGDEELQASMLSDLVVVAWGAKPPFQRDSRALSLFRQHSPDKALYCLGTTKEGYPRHPLYVKADVEPQKFVG